jgi:hypothetical protein
MRTRWVQINGELVLAGTDESNGGYVMNDITPYQSQIDGSMITSRSHHREHLKRHGCIEVGNEKIEHRAATVVPGLKEEVARRVYENLRYS